MAEIKKSVVNAIFDEKEAAKSEHLNFLSRATDDLRRNGFLTDVNLICQKGQPVPAHGVLLAAASPYFYSAFAKENEKTKTSKLQFPNTAAKTMETLLDFIYTGTLNACIPNPDEILQLIALAEKLQIGGIIEYYCSLLLKTLSTTHFLGLWKIAEKHNLQAIKVPVEVFIAKHFPETSNAEEFLLFPSKGVTGVLKQDEIKVHSMDQIFTAILKWVKHDHMRRNSELKTLISFVNFQAVSNECLFQTASDETFLNGSMDLMQILMKTIMLRFKNNLVIPPAEPKPVDNPQMSPLPYNPLPLQPILNGKPDTSSNEDRFIIFKKLDCSEEVLIRCYYPVSQKLSPSSTFKFPLLFNSAVCYHNGSVYFVGGRNKNMEVCDSVFTYNVAESHWSRSASIEEARYNSGAVAVDDTIYVAGGINSNNDILATVEKYDVISGKWTKVAPMIVNRKSPALLQMGKIIFAMSGVGEDHTSPLEFYSLESKQWSLVSIEESIAKSFQERVYFSDTLSPKQRSVYQPKKRSLSDICESSSSNIFPQMAQSENGLQFSEGLSCFLCCQQDLLHVLKRSPSGNIRLYSKKFPENFECRQAASKFRNILTFNCSEISGKSSLLVVDDEGFIQKLNPEDCSCKNLASPLRSPTYAVFASKK